MQEEKSGVKFARTSLIFGGIGFVTSLFYGGIFGIIGLVYGCFALGYKMEGKNMAIAGIANGNPYYGIDSSFSKCTYKFRTG